MAGGLIIWMLLGPFSAVAPTSLPPAELGRAARLLLIVAVLMGILLLGIALMTVIRRLRQRAAGQPVKPAKPLADPWQESANRVRLNPQRQRPADPEAED